MKYEVRWTATKQGVQTTQVDAISTFSATEQVESMYYHLDGFKIYTVTPVFEKNDPVEKETHYYSKPNYATDSSGVPTDLSTIIGALSLFVAGVMVLFGFFLLPSGILAMIIGGSIGFLGMKFSFWLSDRGW